MLKINLHTELFSNKIRHFKKIGGYDQKFVCQDGFYIWMKLILKYKVYNINKPLFYYRRHGKSLTTDNKLINKTRSELLEKLNKKKRKSYCSFSI